MKDLLGCTGEEDAAAADLDVRVGKGPRGTPSVFVEGLVECEVTSLDEVEHLMQEGQRNRHVGSNNVNEHSSRSHLVLCVKIVATRRDTGVMAHGKLNGAMAFMTGKMKISGDRGLANTMKKIFPLIK